MKRKETLIQIIKANLSGETRYQLNDFSIDILQKIEDAREDDNTILPSTIKHILENLPLTQIAAASSSTSSSSSSAGIQPKKKGAPKIPTKAKSTCGSSTCGSSNSDRPKVDRPLVEKTKKPHEQHFGTDTENEEEDDDPTSDGDYQDDADGDADDDDEDDLGGDKGLFNVKKRKLEEEAAAQASKKVTTEKSGAAAASHPNNAIYKSIKEMSKEVSSLHVLKSKTKVNDKDARKMCTLKSCIRTTKIATYCVGCSEKKGSVVRICEDCFPGHLVKKIMKGIKKILEN